MADDEATTDRLVSALTELGGAAASLPRPPAVRVPAPHDLELESVETPRSAFFGRAELVPVEEAVGRIVAEQVTPYPPGIPVLVPGERINAEVLEYLRSGLDAGMVLPDPTDKSLATIRVAVRN
jgi:arginine/lysine/ornithine decarboxylase